MKKNRLSAIALTALMALAVSSCSKDNDIPEPEKEKPDKDVIITYGAPKLKVVAASSNLKDGTLRIPTMGEEPQFTIIAQKAIYIDGVLTDQVKQSKVSDMKVNLASDWATYDKSAKNDSTMQVKVSAPENTIDKERNSELKVTCEGQELNIAITQDKAVVEYSTPVFQNDCKDELLFSRSGDTERKLRFRVISRKTINSKVTEEFTTHNAAGWTWEIDKADVFYIIATGNEEPDIKFLKIKAKANDSKQAIIGTITLKYDHNGIKGTMQVPLNSDKGYIIDIDDGREAEFHD